MILILILLGIVLLSVGLSYLSIRSDMKKQKHAASAVQKDLAKGRVIYYSSSSSDSSSS